MSATMTMPTQTRRRKPEKRLGPLHEPAAFVDGPNQYQYVGGDPVGAMDPMGLAATTQPTTRPSTQPRTILPAGGRIPTKWDTCGGSFPGNINFAGPGWSGIFMTRPVDTWDFISKVHDLLYEVNGLTVWRLGDAKYRSRMSKADYIMRVLHKEESSRSFYGPGMRALFGSSSWPGRLGRRCAATWFKENDGFVNVLRRDGLPELPDKFDRDNDYASLMIPRDALPAPDIGHARKWVSVTTVFHDSDYFVRPEEIEYRLVPSYLVPTDYDYTKDWREWGKEHFGNLWAIAESVTAAVSSLDAGN